MTRRPPSPVQTLSAVQAVAAPSLSVSPAAAQRTGTGEGERRYRSGDEGSSVLGITDAPDHPAQFVARARPE